MMTNSNNDLLREESGNITINSKLVSFLYELMRDHLPAGIVQELVNNSINNDDVIYTNGYLAKYAEYLANKLKY